MQTNQSIYPSNHCYNPAFQYVPAEHTDIRKTFERIKHDQLRTIELDTKELDIDGLVQSWFKLEQGK